MRPGPEAGAEAQGKAKEKPKAKLPLTTPAEIECKGEDLLYRRRLCEKASHMGPELSEIVFRLSGSVDFYDRFLVLCVTFLYCFVPFMLLAISHASDVCTPSQSEVCLIRSTVTRYSCCIPSLLFHRARRPAFVK